MNARQLVKLGVPESCVKDAIQCIQVATRSGLRKAALKETITSVAASPEGCDPNSAFASLAKAILDDRAFVRKAPIPYKVWGETEALSRIQMEQACSVPCAVAAAVMPDSHPGFGICIGGVVALENAVSPFMVGVDIACRMRLSIYDLHPEFMAKRTNLFQEALEQGTRFGVGCEYKPRKEHPVMDEDWAVTKITQQIKDRAYAQLGTSGSGNHFAEFGVIFMMESMRPLVAGQTYVALMSHSGSRGSGSAVCDTYSNIAQARLPPKYKDMGRLAWLDMDTEPGQEYWLAMSLMGQYAAANHEIIHKEVSKLLGETPVMAVENVHNFAWKEVHQGREVIVHRKGATPAGKGVLGIIPGSMGTPGYLVRGLGNPDSLCSASHGAGRKMSRQKAKETYSWQAVRGNLEKQGIIVLSAGADEVPGEYKDVEEVMAAQTDLVDRVAKFFPKIVKMCGDGSKSED